MTLPNQLVCALIGLLACANACGDAEDSPQEIAGTGGRAGQGGQSQSAFGGQLGFGGSKSHLGGEDNYAGAGGFGGSSEGGAQSMAPGGAASAVHSGGREQNSGGNSVALGGSTPVTATAGSAGVPDVVVDAPVLCARLRDDTKGYAEHVAFAYLAAVAQDCRVKGFTELTPTQLPQAANALYAFNFQLWGCTADDPSSFALSLGAPTLSRGDADLLIVLYLDVATNYLQLGTRERERLDAKLQPLAAAAITSSSSELSHFRCSAPGSGGAGAGAGGEAGTNNTAAGAGGTLEAGGGGA